MKGFYASIRSSVNELKNILSLAVSGVLTALNIILNFFTVSVSNLLQFSFSFLAIAAAGMLYGPVVGGLVGVLGDILGNILFPTGPFFVGFTFNAFLTGFVYGLFLYKKPVTLWRVLVANGILVLLINFLLNPLWLSIMYGRAFVVVLSTRLISTLFLFPIHVAMLYFILKFIQKVQVLVLKKA